MVNLDEIHYISSEELKKNFEMYRVLARATVPICIWEEGMDRPDVMLVSGYEWRKIHRKREVIKVEDIGPEFFEALANAEIPKECEFMERLYGENPDVRAADFPHIQGNLCRRTRKYVEVPEIEYDCSKWVEYEELRNAEGEGYSAEYQEYLRRKARDAEENER